MSISAFNQKTVRTSGSLHDHRRARVEEGGLLMSAERMVDRISKVLNQAERAEEGSPEREAFMEKALALSQVHSIDLAVARAHQAKRERVEAPERRSFRVGQPGLSISKNAHFVDLMLAVCAASDVEVVIGGGNSLVHGTGMPSDLDMAERLFAVLSVQMVAEADAGLKRGDNGEWRTDAPKTRRVEIPDDERAWGEHNGSDSHANWCYYDERDEELRDGLRLRYNERTWRDEWVKTHPPPRSRVEVVPGEFERKFVSLEDARVWRVNFYQGFVSRTAVRLREARRRALLDAGIDVADAGDKRAVALRDKSREVREAFEENEKFVLSSGRAYGGAEVSRHSYGGQLAGDGAARRAALGDEKVL